MQGPWYTLEDTVDKLNISLSELHHLVSQGEIQPVVCTKSRRFLLYRAIGENWTGFATCDYRGHILFPQAITFGLMDGDTVELQGRGGQLLEESGVQSWRPAIPFENPLPHGPLTDWQATKWGEVPITRFTATPLPSERETTASTIQQTVNTLMAANPKLYSPHLERSPLYRPSAEPDIRLVFDNATFTPDDLRVPASEIEAYQQRQRQALHRVPAGSGGSKLDTRENQLHTLVDRILEQYPDISAKAAWKIIQDEPDLDAPVFDQDEILERVDAECIEWRSRNGTRQALKWASFRPLLSNRKKARQQS